MVDTSKAMFTANEVAELLSCSTTMVYKLVRTGRIEATKLGSMVRIPRSGLVKIGAIDKEASDVA